MSGPRTVAGRVLLDTPGRLAAVFEHDRERLLNGILAIEDEAIRSTLARIRGRLADNHNTLGAEVYRLDQIEDLLDELGA